MLRLMAFDLTPVASLLPESITRRDMMLTFASHDK